MEIQLESDSGQRDKITCIVELTRDATIRIKLYNAWCNLLNHKIACFKIIYIVLYSPIVSVLKMTSSIESLYIYRYGTIDRVYFRYGFAVAILVVHVASSFSSFENMHSEGNFNLYVFEVLCLIIVIHLVAWTVDFFTWIYN